MAPVAQELSVLYSVLEPLQTKATIQEQLEELKTVVKENGHLPIALIGYSWGAILSYLFTTHNPSIVKKLILISSGVFEDRYAPAIVDIIPGMRRKLKSHSTLSSNRRYNNFVSKDHPYEKLKQPSQGTGGNA
jgi:pimeloyl-ACP methyl ester carboxylesterase